MKCTKCSAESKLKKGTTATTATVRLPRGWKRLGEVVFCGNCWKGLYHLRAITFPLAGPIDRDDWKALREALTAAWANATMLANWTITLLAKADTVRTPDMKKLPSFKVPYLYPEARAVCPTIDPQSVVAILNSVQANYLKRRIDTIWRGSASLQTYRFPLPYPVPSQGWSARWLSETEKVPIVKVRISGTSFELRLRGGPSFYRQLADFSKIVDGDAVPGEMAIYRVRGNANDNRPGLPGREGGQSVSWTIMIKLVAWIPKAVPKEKKDKAVTLAVRTEKERFLVADPDGAHPWVINAEQVLRWQMEHHKRRQHLAEDRKYEKRWPAEQGQQMQDRLTNWVKKHQRRMDTWCHQTSASLVAYAIRQHVTTLEYDDRKTMTSDFPWFKLKTMLANKLNAVNIAFSHVSASEEEAEETTDPLAPVKKKK